MSELIPAFDFIQVFVEPWRDHGATTFWIWLMGFFVTVACGWVGNYLILRRMALVGDAISHSILPGLAVAFLLAGSRSTTVMFLGALAAGAVTTLIIEAIHKNSRVKQDAAIGIAFTSLFAIGVILISLFAARVDLDAECVLYGEIEFVPLASLVQLGDLTLGPLPVVRMGILMSATLILIWIFYKELLVSSFDPALAFSLGINSTAMHYALMAWLSLVVVGAFESVGAILVIAMLILPGATALLLTNRLPVMHGLTVIYALLSTTLGVHLATWLNCSTAGAMVVMGGVLFCLAWVFSPRHGLLQRVLRKLVNQPVDVADTFPESAQ